MNITRLHSIDDFPEKKTALLFSGGLDSSAVAVLLLQNQMDVTLIAINNGAHKWFELAAQKAEYLMHNYPNSCRFKVLDSSYLFRELVIKQLAKDVPQYGHLICCGCKLAMLAEAIIYCKTNNLRTIADGFKKVQNYYPEQTPEFMNPTRLLAQQYGITLAHPVYEGYDQQLEDIALSGNIPSSPIQPFCLFERNPIVGNTHVLPYVESKLAALREYIDSRI